MDNFTGELNFCGENILRDFFGGADCGTNREN